MADITDYIAGSPEDLAKICKKCSLYFDPKTGDMQLSKHSSPSCDNDYCRKYWAIKKSKVLQEIVKIKPITFWLTLNFLKKVPSHDEFKAAWRKVMETLRYHAKKKRKTNPDYEFDIRLYVDCTEKKVDFNLLVWTNAYANAKQAKKYMKPILKKKYKGYRFRLWGEPPDTQIAVSKYATGDILAKDKRCLPPADWRGEKFVLGSRKPMNGRTETEIWKEICDAKYGNRKPKPENPNPKDIPF